MPRLPFDNPSALGIDPQMRAIQKESAITRVQTAGADAWLVTRYDEVRALLADRRLGLSNPNPDQTPVSAARSFMVALMAGDDYATEATRHAQMRELLVPLFSTGRMRLLQGRIEHHVDDLLAHLAASTPPADLHRALSFPLPTMAISDLLGVPSADRERFGQWARGTFDQSDNQHSENTFQLVVDYMTELVAHKRIEPGNDILSELIAAKDGALSDADIAHLGNAVLLFGYETTIVRIDLGTLLLRNPTQRALLAENPGLAPAAVEEILRLGVGGKGSNALVPRYASLYVGLLSLLDHSHDLSGQHIALLSYGSGCVAEFFTITMQPGYREHLRAADTQRSLAARTPISHEQYLALRNKPADDGHDREFDLQTTSGFRLAAISDEQRIYRTTIEHVGAATG